MNQTRKNGTCIIIGAGDLTVGSFPYNVDSDYIIAADGGLMYCGVLEIEPDLIIGDFDSLEGEYKEALAAIQASCPDKVITLPTEKDDTDMLAAVKCGLELGYRSFRLYGANGGRLEHTIANIQLLKYLKEQGAVGYIMDGQGMILLAQNETISFRDSMEGYINIFSLNEKAHGVTLRGLKYELDCVT
ncbi:MAG: thiamine diphosphokinase, partial [Lachnospiraceae bacterium]|nr:thiamine diphosphokinase [Lachnospiraceae bacterium]